MKTYNITRSAPTGPNWDAVPQLSVDHFLWLPSADIRVTAQFCWDDTAIYARYQAAEPNVRAEHNGPFSMVCEDSCMEFFLQPIETDPRFFNFEWNPNGCSFIGIETNSHDLIRLCPMNEKKLFQPWTARTSDGWTLEYRVPHEFVRMFFPAYHPASGGTVRANCYKCGDLTVQPHYMAWSPVRKSTPDFHQSCDFGVMRFD